MIEIHGRPFLEYLIEMLREQGFERVLLLLGYLPETVQRHFGDGRRWGVKLDYSITAVEDETGRRVRLAAPKIDDAFLLMYCDNYWPMQMDRMWARFRRAGAPALLTVYTNTDGYTKRSVRVDAEGFVTAYDKSGATPDVQGVEISYAILTKPVLDLLPDGNVSFEQTVYPALIARRQLAAYVTDHRYYSVGSLGRLPLTEAFLARRPTVILDRDGVLNVKPPRAQYVRTWREFEWLPGAREALRLFTDAGYRIVLVSNQAGVARGAMREADLLDIHERLKADAAQAGGAIDAIYYCPHDWDEGCACRKPKPGMLFQVQRDHHVDLTRTLFIGDDERDAEAADAAGCPSLLVTKDRTLLDIARGLLTHAQTGGALVRT
jgi:D-glycero-D-manno-heptose 1,7-bisphosphate phosphatase